MLVEYKALSTTITTINNYCIQKDSKSSLHSFDPSLNIFVEFLVIINTINKLFLKVTN